MRWWKFLRLWCGLVGRTNQADYRTGPILAARIAYGIHIRK